MATMICICFAGQRSTSGPNPPADSSTRGTRERGRRTEPQIMATSIHPCFAGQRSASMELRTGSNHRHHKNPVGTPNHGHVDSPLLCGPKVRITLAQSAGPKAPRTGLIEHFQPRAKGPLQAPGLVRLPCTGRTEPMLGANLPWPMTTLGAWAVGTTPFSTA
jgi:hypothetical protein